MENKVNIYALILNYNSSLETIELFQLLHSFNFQLLSILVLDNNSKKEDIAELRNKIPNYNLIFNDENLGYAGGNNVGIEIALKNNADYVWLLNPDIRIEQQTLPLLLKTISEDSTLAAVGPRIVRREDKNLIFSDGEILKMDETCLTSHKNYNLKVTEVQGTIDYSVDYIDGSSILLNCKAIQKLGKLPEEYFLYFEETDWCFRAKKHHWKLAVNSNATVYNLTSSRNAVFNYYMMRNKLIFSKKYHPYPKKVRNFYLNQLMMEVLFRFKGKYFKPFYKDRVKGLFSGIIKTGLYT